MAGDPLFDLGVWANAASPDLLLRGYAPDTATDTDTDTAETIAFYRVASALQIIVSGAAATAFWFPGLLQGTRNALDHLDSM